MKMTGVTGTNGKTTITFLLAQCLTQLREPCAVIGTLGYGLFPELTFTGFTTPDRKALPIYCKEIEEKGARSVAMEVSSHGLQQDRAIDIPFESAIFTNLTQDHLDYHGDMESYGKAKQKLFRFSSLQRAVINADSSYAETIMRVITANIPIILCTNKPVVRASLLNAEQCIHTICVEHYQLDENGIRATVKTPFGQGELRSVLLGEFNLNNLLLVLAELLYRGFALTDALNALAKANGAPGRMQRLGGGESPQIIIDYAHTPDALENALKAARHHCRRRLWCVFGCGGDRDKDKRAKMGAIAGQLADRIVLTNDNPRTEAPHEIIQGILQGIVLDIHDKVRVEEDRQKAIAYAMTHALAMDTILIAGKGHEDYQIIGEKKYSFSDEKCVKAFLGEGSG